MDSDAPSHDLRDFVREAATEISLEYARIRRRSQDDPGTAGDEGEENWAELLRRWLPEAYHVVTKGRVLSSEGVGSGQLDVLVLAPSYPSGLLNKKVYLAAGVIAAFQCKNTLRLQHTGEAVAAGVQLKRMMREDDAVTHEAIYGLLAHAHNVQNVEKSAVQSFGESLARADATCVNDPRDCIDLMCVANLGTWSVLKVSLGSDYSTVYMGPLEGNGVPGFEPSEPVGRFLTTLLRWIGRGDDGLARIGKYLHAVGLEGTGQGTPRDWDAAGLPAEALVIQW